MPELNHAHPRPVTEGIPFLGFTVFPQRRRLKRRKGIHFQRKLRNRMAAYRAGDIPLAEVTACVQGWVSHARYANMVGLRKAVLWRPLGRSYGKDEFRAQVGYTTKSLTWIIHKFRRSLGILLIRVGYAGTAATWWRMTDKPLGAPSPSSAK